MKSKGLKFITKTAIIAAIYTALTLVIAPFSFGIMQFRISEMLTVLPRYSKSSIYGLAIGCFIANYIGGIINGSVVFIDVILGTLATLIAAILSYMVRKNKYLVPIFPVILNGLIVGTYLHYFVFNTIPLFVCILSVAVSEAVTAYGLGIGLINILDKHRDKISD